MLKILIILLVITSYYGCEQKVLNPQETTVQDTVIITILDTVIIDTIFKDTSTIDTIIQDTLPIDTIIQDTVIDTLSIDTIITDTVPVDTIEIIPIHVETTTIYSYGVTCTVMAEYKDTVRHGVYTITDPNGVLRAKEHYVNGLREGMFQYWYENRQLSIEAICSAGVYHGYYKQWYDNGQRRSSYTYILGILFDKPKNFFIGAYQTWWPNGNKKRSCNWKSEYKSTVHNYPTGHLIHGGDTSWYETGDKEYIHTYKDAKPDGLQAWWYTDGKPKSHLYYENDKVHGQVLVWDSTGKITQDRWVYYGYTCEDYAEFLALKKADQ